MKSSFELAELQVSRRFIGQCMVVPLLESLGAAVASLPLGEPSNTNLPPTRFVVLFALNSAKLTDAAKHILQSAAKASASSGVRVVGYADSVGTDEYNLWLSQRRARIVALTLVKLGVPSLTIAVDWKGEFEPVVPTTSPMPQPANRRVVIELLAPS